MKILNLNSLRNTRKPKPKPESTSYGMKLHLPETLTEDELLRSLARIPASAYKLREGQGVALDFAGRSCSRRLILHMINSIVWEKGIRVIAWLSGNEESVKLFRAAGLSVSEPAEEIQNAPKPEPKPESPKEEKEDKEPEQEKKRISGLKIVYNSMRSGQRVETEGDVLLWGHLNPGAEILAGGSIIVAGRLLGVVHAGGFGREDVFVWAGSFETPQVRIANKLCYADPKSTTCWRKGVVITLEDGTPVIRENKFTGGLKS